jgi:ACS family tartrate transporter-like MFS transporter
LARSSNAESLTDVSGPAVISKLTRRLVPFLFLLYIVAYLDRINVGFAKLQMSGQLHFSEAVYGLAAGLFFAGYFLFQVPSNMILQKIGARRWIALLMIVWGAISASMMLVTTARSFYTLRFLLGLAEAGFFPGVILYLRNWFPARARARTIALFMTAGPLSGVIGGLVSGALLTLDRMGGLAGWQWLFLLEGVPAVLLGMVVFFHLADRPNDATWLSGDERQWLAGTLLVEERSNSPGVGIGEAPWWSVFVDPRVWMLALVYFCLTTSSYGIMLWLPSVVSHLSDRGTLVIGALSAIPYIAAAVGMVVSGYHSDRTGERRWHVAGCALLAAAAFSLAALSTSTVAVIAAVSFSVLGINGMLGPFWAIPGSFLTGITASAGIALINSVGNLGGFVGPYILGLARTSSGNFKSGLFLLAGAMALAAVFVLLVRMPGSNANPTENLG